VMTPKVITKPIAKPIMIAQKISFFSEVPISRLKYTA
jgi:hypothetical protein